MKCNFQIKYLLIKNSWVFIIFLIFIVYQRLSNIIKSEMASTQTDPSNIQTKVRIFRFLQLNWTQILTGLISVDPSQQKLKIKYKESNNDHLIPSCPPHQIKESNQKQITIEFSRLSKIQQDQNDRKIVYIWIDVNPYSFSFLKESRASQICNLLQLLEQNIQLNQNEDQNLQIGAEYIKNCIQSNPGMLTTMFINKKAQIIEVLVKTIEISLQYQVQQSVKQDYFQIFQNAIKLGDKSIIQKLITNQCYPTLLKILSWNPFNVIPFDYLKQYNSKVNFNNALGITKKQILNSYQEIARVKFLRDVAACMFTQIQNQKIFQNIINSNSQTILYELAFSQKTFDEIVQIRKENPKTFLNIFIQLWEIYKNTIVDYEFRLVKPEFMKKFIQKDLHNIAIKAVSDILDSPQLSQTVNVRFYERWMDAFNPFLTNNWSFSQQWICSSNDDCSLLSILYRLLNKVRDQGLIQSILNFIKGFFQSFDHQTKIQCKFRSHVYNQLIAKVWPIIIMESSLPLMEIYTDFIIKIYKFDYIRTRRVIIQQKVLQQFDLNLSKKPIIICVLKILTTFMQHDNKDVFVYLQNHQLFKGLRQQYLRNICSHNIIGANFKNLLNKISLTENKQVRKYFELIFLPNERNGVQN